MADLKKTLEDIASSIVDHPDKVNVAYEETDDAITLTLNVDPDDMVIGRHGRIAKAIRTLMKAAAANTSKKINVDIR